MTKGTGNSIIVGGAGTGKTVLGMSRAQQLAMEGKKVLYICANRSLAQHLRAEVELLGQSVHENLTVDTASAFITGIGRDGATKEKYEKRRKAFPVKWDRFLDAVTQSGHENSIDCLVVDEAQDVSRVDLDMIELLVKSPKDGGSTIILGDPNQHLMLGRIESALGSKDLSQSISLDVNCRNTLEIATVAHSFTDQEVDTLDSVSGINVRKSLLRESIDRQVLDEVSSIRMKYNPNQIIVLTFNGIADLGSNESLFLDGPRWEFANRRQVNQETEEVYVYSAPAFQGREADAVILVLTEKSLLRTFPFRRLSEIANKSNQILARQESVIDLRRVEGMFKKFCESTVQKRVKKFKDDLELNGSSLSENRKAYLVREFERACEMEFSPHFSDPILDTFWKKKQKESLKVSLYSMMTRSRVILSIVGDDRALKFIESELNSRDDEGAEYLREI